MAKKNDKAASEKDATPREAIAVVRLAVSAIKPSKDNRPLNVRHVAELGESIRAAGLLVPIIVKENGKGAYEIVAGHHRFAAVKERLKLDEIDCIINNDGDRVSLRHIENAMHLALSPLDEADEIKRQRDAGKTDKEIAAVLGRAPIYIIRRGALLGLTPKTRALVEKLKVEWPVSVLETIAATPEDVQLAIFKDCMDRETAPPLSQVHRMIANMSLRLASAPFKLDDATILPKCGACLACPKRTGADSDLFGALKIGGKDDTCLDVKCFKAKSEEAIKRLVDKLRGETPELIVFKARDRAGYGSEHERQKRIEESFGAVAYPDDGYYAEPSKYQPCKKSDDGALKGVFVTGNSAGQIVYVLPKSKAAKAKGESSKPKVKKAADKLSKDEKDALKKEAETIAAQNLGDGNLKNSKADILDALERRVNHEHKRKAWFINWVADYVRGATGMQTWENRRTGAMGKNEAFGKIKARILDGDLYRRVAIIAAVFMSRRSWEVIAPRGDKPAERDEHSLTFKRLLSEWRDSAIPPFSNGGALATEMQLTLLDQWLGALPGILTGEIKTATGAIYEEAEVVAHMIGINAEWLRAMAAEALPFPKSWGSKVTDTWANPAIITDGKKTLEEGKATKAPKKKADPKPKKAAAKKQPKGTPKPDASTDGELTDPDDDPLAGLGAVSSEGDDDTDDGKPLGTE